MSSGVDGGAAGVRGREAGILAHLKVDPLEGIEQLTRVETVVPGAQTRHNGLAQGGDDFLGAHVPAGEELKLRECTGVVV